MLSNATANGAENPQNSIKTGLWCTQKNTTFNTQIQQWVYMGGEGTQVNNDATRGRNFHFEIKIKFDISDRFFFFSKIGGNKVQ